MTNIKYDIIIQGAWYDTVLRNAKNYEKLDFVNKVFISTWENAPINQSDIKNENIILLKNKIPDYAGPGNLNLHLISTKNALKSSNSKMIIKFRSDQTFYDGSIFKMLNFYEKYKNEITINYLTGEKQKSKIFITGNGSHFPYHPQDHTFWGFKEDIEKIFNIPLSNAPPIGNEPVDFSIHLRNPIYIGAHYYSLFFPIAKYHLANREKFLLDNSPGFNESLRNYLKLKDTIFKPFPKIDIFWDKFNTGYKYDLYEPQGEYYSNEV